MKKGAFFIFNFVVEDRVTLCESQLKMYFPVRLSISRFSSKSEEMTIGLTLRLWGDMGVTTKLPLPGIIIGPPQLNEYAVEPVGVAMINPSAQ